MKCMMLKFINSVIYSYHTSIKDKNGNSKIFFLETTHRKLL